MVVVVLLALGSGGWWALHWVVRRRQREGMDGWMELETRGR